MSATQEPAITSTAARSPAFGYGVAILSILCAFALRLAFDSLWSDRLPYAWFFLAVLVAARFAETGPQIFTILAGILLGDYFFVHPRYSLEIASRVDQINLA